MLHSNYIQILLNLKDISIINFSDTSVTIYKKAVTQKGYGSYLLK